MQSQHVTTRHVIQRIHISCSVLSLAEKPIQVVGESPQIPYRQYGYHAVTCSVMQANSGAELLVTAASL